MSMRAYWPQVAIGFLADNKEHPTPRLQKNSQIKIKIGCSDSCESWASLEKAGAKGMVICNRSKEKRLQDGKNIEDMITMACEADTGF